MVNKSTYHKIRPSSRIISTIGEDIIKDVHAAIVEMVKNAYDADANTVIIDFSTFKSENSDEDFLKIVILDDGHGMTYDVVVNKWMVPATSDKLERKYSPKGRLMQGRKGIGRYAAAILGNIMKLETVSSNGEKTSLEIDWNEINKHQYLEDINVYIESMRTDEPHGTRFTIIGGNDKLHEWTENELDLLKLELRKLMSPIMKDTDEFNVILSFHNFPVRNYDKREIEIHPFPLLDLFDYRLSGTVSETGHAVLKFENNSVKGIPAESFTVDIPLDGIKAAYCGPLEIDLRIFDRDPDAISNLISKGVKDPDTGQYLGKNETKRLLDQICGIAIYRGDFRIRPHGDPGYDWIKLDERRVQDPSLRIGRNQVSGFVLIQSEEISKLEEKSARDGLKENKYYEGLKEIVTAVLKQAENRRYAFRAQTGRGRRKVKIYNELDKLIDLAPIALRVEKAFLEAHVSSEKLNEVLGYITTIQKEKAKEIELIRNEIAIYQGQATLGKIIMVLMHEGRKPLSWFRNQAEFMPGFLEELMNGVDEELIKRVKERALCYKQQSDIIVRLFDKLEPLAVKKRGRSKKIDIKKCILAT